MKILLRSPGYRLPTPRMHLNSKLECPDPCGRKTTVRESKCFILEKTDAGKPRHSVYCCRKCGKVLLEDVFGMDVPPQIIVSAEGLEIILKSIGDLGQFEDVPDEHDPWPQEHIPFRTAQAAKRAVPNPYVTRQEFLALKLWITNTFREKLKD